MVEIILLALAFVAGLFAAVLVPKLYAWASRTAASVKKEDHS